VEIGLGVAFGQDAGIAGVLIEGSRLLRRHAAAHRLQRRFDDLGGIDEPLVGEHRLDDHLGAVAMGLHHPVLLDQGDVFEMFGAGRLVDRLVQHGDGEALGGDLVDDALARLIPVKAAQVLRHEIQGVDLGVGERKLLLGNARVQVALADQPRPRDLLGDGRRLGIGRAIASHRGPGVHQPVAGDVVALGHGVVVEVMRAGDLDRAGAEIRVGVFIGDDRDLAAVLLRPDRDFAEFPDDWRVTLI